jgi:murein DD-endopeptidase MepM/ murein hydrolase activator NlpD
VWSRRALAILYSALAVFAGVLVVFTSRNRPAKHARPRAASERLVSEVPAAAAETRVPTSPVQPALAVRPVLVTSPEPVPPIAMPIAGLKPADLRDSFAEIHGGHRHEAIDILEPRGTPVLAVDDGVIVKKFRSVPGGITIYQFNPDRTLCYYYAHLERYAEPLAEGQRVARGDTIGFVGTSGNAPPQTPHLHFAVYVLGPERRWWEGTAIDPYPLLLKARTAP